MSDESSAILLLADGVRPDTLEGAMARGDLPAMAALAAEGARHTIVTCFPSVSVAGYVPMLMGRHPASVGLPGLRWYDRARRVVPLAGHARSYVGAGMRRLDADLDPGLPTAFELLPGRSLGFMSAITRGLGPPDRLGAGAVFSLRAAWRHVRGDVAGWLELEREAARTLVAQIRERRPRFVFAAFPGYDKAAHAAGGDSPPALEALRTVDAVAAEIRRDAERDGRWQAMHLWVVSDHGHMPVAMHFDLAGFVKSLGFRVRAHPWTTPAPAGVAVMVSGNAMAHLYVELHRRVRPFWPDLASRWTPVVEALLSHPAVDILALPHSAHCIEVHGRGRGSALIARAPSGYSCRLLEGDPLGTGSFEGCGAAEVLTRSADGPYPDAVAQLIALCASPRAGDIVVSASAGWDLRSRYEPLVHVSTHGALHRDQMRVPLLLNRPVPGRPSRTVDLLPSVLRALGVREPRWLEGEAFT